MENLLLELQNYVDIGIICIYLFSGILAKRMTKISKVSTTWKTIILGTLSTLVYVYLMRLDGSVIEWTKVLFSYALATTFYDVLLKWLFARIGLNNSSNSLITTDVCQCIDNYYYDAVEMNQDELDILLSDNVYFEYFVYCDNHIYYSYLADETNTNAFEVRSFFVGTRPPKKPVRV